jgi:hypothetical protein
MYIPDLNTFNIRRVLGVTKSIEKFAGTGSRGTIRSDGVRSTVNFFSPYSVVGNTAGVLFISDMMYIRRVDIATDVVTVIVGSIAVGFAGDNDPASSAQLNSPKGIWLTTSGDLYIADSGNHRIRKVTSTGMIMTIAGSGCSNGCSGGYAGDNNFAILASLNDPRGVYVDTTGKLFIADAGNNRVRLVNSINFITTFAGSGSGSPFNGEQIPATSANIYLPCDVKGDSQGNVYIADGIHCVVRTVDTNGIIRTLFGTPDSCGFSPGISTRKSPIGNPIGIWVDSLANVYFSDYNSIHRGIIAVTPTSQPSSQPSSQPTTHPTVAPLVTVSIQLVAGMVSAANSPSGGPATSTSIRANIPFVDSNGNIYIPEDSNRVIRTVSPIPGIISTFAGTGTLGNAGVGGPVATMNINSPYSVVGDTAGTMLLVSDQLFIWKINLVFGIVSVYAGTSTPGFFGDTGPASSAQLYSPAGLWLTTTGDLYIADKDNNRVRKVTPSAIITTVVGSGTADYFGDSGVATSAKLTNPRGVYVATNGNLYIADTGNNRIRLVDTNNIITTFAGTGIQYPFNNGVPATSANIFLPYDVKGDLVGNIYIAEKGSCVISKVDRSRIITALFGTPGSCGFTTGSSAGNSAIHGPIGIWVDSLASIYFSDNNSIHQGIVVAKPTRQPTGQPTCQPSRLPTIHPTGQPICRPTSQPTGLPRSQPTRQPTARPSSQPSTQPSRKPSEHPTAQPSVKPSDQPTKCPVGRPSSQPTSMPSTQPITSPSRCPSSPPTICPSRQPIGVPTSQPSGLPSWLPVSSPSTRPSSAPSSQPTTSPSLCPTAQPSSVPSTSRPTSLPSSRPSFPPSSVPTAQPISFPTRSPSSSPTSQPTKRPSSCPSGLPTRRPTSFPSCQPSNQPTFIPTNVPSVQPSSSPSVAPYGLPSVIPTVLPSQQPSSFPSDQPISNPTSRPSSKPSHQPFSRPTLLPSSSPSISPSFTPTVCPSGRPSRQPTASPSRQPVTSPSGVPTERPRGLPSSRPSRSPSTQPSSRPSVQPISRPSCFPSGQPTNRPTGSPTSFLSLPRVILKVPPVQSVCTGLLFDLSTSTGNLNHPWRNITIEVTSTAFAGLTIELQRFLKNHYKGLVNDLAPPLQLPTEYFKPNVNYSFTVSICNVLGACGSTHRVLRMIEVKVPTVSIVGSGVREMTRSQSLLLISSVQKMACNDSVLNLNALIYNWQITNSARKSELLKSTSNDPSRYLLPSYSLQSNQAYTITLIVTYLNSNVSSAVQVRIKTGDVKAVITGSDQQMMRPGSVFKVDGTESYDEDKENLKGANAGLVFSWSCLRFSGNSLFPSCSDLFQQELFTASSHAPLLSLKANESAANSKVRITLFVKNPLSGRNDSKSIQLTILPSLYPVITLSSNVDLTKSNRINPSQSLQLKANISFATPGLHGNLTWLSSSNLNLSSFPSTPTVRSILTSPLKLTVYLALPRNSLAAGQSYSFGLRCKLEGNIQVTNFITVSVNIPPSSGKFGVSPSSGTAYLEAFALTCSNWIDTDLPLSYQFSFLSLTGRTLITKGLTPLSYSSTVLPEGQKENNQLVTCQADIYDSMNANTTTFVTTQVHPLLKTNISLLVRQNIDPTLAIDLDDLIKGVNIASSLLNQPNCTLSPNCTALNRFPCLSTSHTCGPCQSSFFSSNPEDGNELCVKDASNLVINKHPKECFLNCSDRGSCIYYSHITGKRVEKCFTGDLSCYTTCSCSEGYKLSNYCEISDSETKLFIQLRELVVSRIVSNIKLQDPTEQAVSGWMNSLLEVAQAPNQISENALSSLLELSNSALTTVQSEGYDIDTSLPKFIEAMNSLSAVIPYTNTVMIKQTRRLDSKRLQSTSD